MAVGEIVQQLLDITTAVEYHPQFPGHEFGVKSCVSKELCHAERIEGRSPHHDGSGRALGSCVIFDGGIVEPPNRQGTALFNQGIDLLNHGIASKTAAGVRLELARHGWQ